MCQLNSGITVGASVGGCLLVSVSSRLLDVSDAATSRPVTNCLSTSCLFSVMCYMLFTLHITVTWHGGIHVHCAQPFNKHLAVKE